MTKTLCWNCNFQYPITDKQCPICCATNANIDSERAEEELINNELISHDWQEVDDSFSHEFGIERVKYLRCTQCGKTAAKEPIKCCADCACKESMQPCEACDNSR